MKTGLIGVGLMGLGMALRLRDAGWPLAVRDLLPEREALAVAAGAVALPTPAAVGAASELLIVAVVDAAQTDELLFGADGAAAAMAPGACVMLCPTIGPGDVARIAQRLSLIHI